MQSPAAAEDHDRIEKRLAESARSRRSALIKIISELVALPSENTPPSGSELECQRYIGSKLEGLGLKAELYEPETVAGLREHPVFREGRDYTNRPNLMAVRPGTGGGSSLLFSGHADTVPRGSEPWQRNPFGGGVEGTRLYGLGANDMKGGIAAILLAVELLRDNGIVLRGDLLLETIVDEEFGGVNGTLAARLRGHNADAAIVCEPSQGVICPAQTGGRTAHITLRSQSEGILYGSKPKARVVDQLRYLLDEIEKFTAYRRASAPVHRLYAVSADPVPVWVTKIHCGGWGPKEPETIPPSCRIELYWQAMPGEDNEKIDREFFRWMDGVVSKRPELFPVAPEINFPIRWLPGSAIDPGNGLVTGLARTYASVAGRPAEIQGIAGPCDMFVFHQYFNTPAVLFGPRGGNTHAPDEWVDIDSALLTAETLARFACRWCGVDWNQTSL